MLLPKLMGAVDEFRKFTQMIRAKVNALKELREAKGRGWVPTEEEEWARVRNVNVPRNFMGVIRTASHTYMHMPGGYLLELPLANPGDAVLTVQAGDVMLLESPARVALGTEEFMQSFSDALVNARERAFEELVRRMAHQRRG